MSDKNTKQPKQSNVELIDEQDEIFELTDSDGKKIEFYGIACVELDDEFYMVMQPVEALEDLADDEVLIFKLAPDPDDEEFDLYQPVEDDALSERVFEEYMRAVADEE